MVRCPSCRKTKNLTYNTIIKIKCKNCGYLFCRKDKHSYCDRHFCNVHMKRPLPAIISTPKRYIDVKEFYWTSMKITALLNLIIHFEAFKYLDQEFYKKKFAVNIIRILGVDKFLVLQVKPKNHISPNQLIRKLCKLLFSKYILSEDFFDYNKRRVLIMLISQSVPIQDLFNYPYSQTSPLTNIFVQSTLKKTIISILKIME